jgi:hypothetical protein
MRVRFDDGLELVVQQLRDCHVILRVSFKVVGRDNVPKRLRPEAGRLFEIACGDGFNPFADIVGASIARRLYAQRCVADSSIRSRYRR